MELITVNKEKRKVFLEFYKKQYLNNDLKRDTLSGMLKNILYGSSKLCSSVDTEPVMVVDNNEIIIISVLAYAHRMPEYLQICFFESEKFNMDAFNLILNRAKDMAKEKNASWITGSLNIHVNYGLGFLSSGFDKKQTFGAPYNPEFYNDYFEKSGFETIHMVSYKKDMSNSPELINNDVREKLKELYTVRKTDFRNFKKEIEIYTQINNEAFNEHLFYYTRKTEEDYELFKELKYLMNEENLIFVEKHGVPVGFLLWYPDFNEIINKNETVGIKTVLKNKLFPHRIKTFKIVEIGVIPEERNKGAILALFDYCYKCINGRYDTMESSWILSDNLKSKSFGIKWADKESKHYKAYVKEII
ncbi:MAG TPA: hypothetical protein DC024_09175 [Clostridiales bacterium]|jgi:hypothetical protein|nr:hypothetical protein [Clostridiales bacterium]HCS10443.1 hypothetical protein [Clostridiales bacterium]